jgi:hypothetical protein
MYGTKKNILPKSLGKSGEAFFHNPDKMQDSVAPSENANAPVFLLF